MTTARGRRSTKAECAAMDEQVLAILRRCIEAGDETPTQRVMGDELGLPAYVVAAAVKRLERRGAIRPVYGRNTIAYAIPGVGQTAPGLCCRGPARAAAAAPVGAAEPGADGKHRNARCGEQALWCAVLEQAMSDAARRRRLDGGPRPAHEIERDVRWVSEPSLDLRIVCDLAGVEMDGVLRWGRATHTAKGGRHGRGLQL